ncbi:MAG: hypothetical protein PHU25_05700 [Deltaproteobacteria bacterium]|nr:hypothetical protein [Deltaproteobacteria bacterium]
MKTAFLQFEKGTADQGRSARATPVHLTRASWQLAFAQFTQMSLSQPNRHGIAQFSREQLAMFAKQAAQPDESDGMAFLRHAMFLTLLAHVSLLHARTLLMNSGLGS